MPAPSPTRGEGWPAARRRRLRADAERLRQVLESSITNATQHSPSGAPVRVRLTERGDHACIGVCDQGSGIPSEIRPKIFEHFVTGRSGGGLGLG